MKKLMLFFAVAAAVSFAACSNANKAQEAQEANQEEIEAPVAPVVEEALDVDSVATVVVDSIAAE